MKDKFKTHFDNVGSNVKRLRKNKGWTQHELASKCSVNREKISRIENGTSDFMFSTLLEVSEGLGVDIMDVVVKYIPSQEEEDNSPTTL
jgi:transcriptional regulator with XRE-family HTH domain